jgi:hypothetical protein
VGNDSAPDVSVPVPARRPDDAAASPSAIATAPDIGLIGPLTPGRTLALQRTAGNTLVSRLVAARQPSGTANPPAPPPPAPPAVTPFGWSDVTLGQRVDTGTAEQLGTYLAGLAPAARDAAILDLQGARRFYRQQLAGADDARRRAIGERVQRADVALQGHYRTIAVGQVTTGPNAPPGGWPAGSRPTGLMAGTHAPSQAERDQLRNAMAPARRRTASGQLADFHSVIPGQTDAYEQRIYRTLHEEIDRLYADLVRDKGPTEHADLAHVNPFDRYEAIADIAKEETDGVFGKYITGPPFRHGRGRHLGNLRDRFEEEQGAQAALGPRGRRRQAEQLIEYFIQSGYGGITRINTEHDAVPERTTLSPGESRSEAAILHGAVVTIAAAREAELLAIDRGWEGTAGGGIVSLQRWRVADEAGDPAGQGQRRHFWDVFQTMIHEYLHTLTHERYYAYARTLPGGDAGVQYNTLVEGMTSAMTEIVWANVAARVGQPALSERVEGTTLYVDEATSRAACPPIPARYPSYHQAMEMISVVGPRNVFAAYLLGEIDMIRASPVARP